MHSTTTTATTEKQKQKYDLKIMTTIQCSYSHFVQYAQEQHLFYVKRLQKKKSKNIENHSGIRERIHWKDENAMNRSTSLYSPYMDKTFY